MTVRNPTFNQFGTIDCEVEHPVLGWIPFTADPSDRPDIYDAALGLGPAPYSPPAPSLDELARQARSERNAHLAASDWTQVPDAPVDQAAWAAYRQALRDVPEQPGFPQAISWPVQP